MPRISARPVVLTAALAVATLVLFSPSGVAETFDVNSTADYVDFNPGDSICSIGDPIWFPRICTLRAAVQEANEWDDGRIDVINLPAGTYRRTLAGDFEDEAATGDLDVTAPLAIVGDGANTTVIDASGLDRVVHVHETSLVLRELTLTGGLALAGGSTWPGGQSRGGGIAVDQGGVLSIQLTRVARNRARGPIADGAGVHAYYGFDVLILDSVFEENLCEGRYLPGGFEGCAAIDLVGGNNPSSAEVSGTTVHGTRCRSDTGETCLGAGIDASHCSVAPGTGLVLVNSTVSGNSGDGLDLRGCHGAIDNSTIVDNGKHGIQASSDSTTSIPNITARNTIIAGNGLGDCDLSGTDTWGSALQHNLSSDDTCQLSPVINDKVNTDPQLHSLGHHRPDASFIAPAHSPKWGSVVVNQGQDLAAVTDDQYDRPRPLDGSQVTDPSHDMGAVEVWPCIVLPDLVVDSDIDATEFSIVKQACRSITTSGPITVHSDPGYKVRFWARDLVVLEEGFTVDDSSEFQVNIVPWAGTPL